MMTSLERVLAALAFKETDRVPVSPLVCGASRRVYGITYKEWSHDPVLATQSLLHAQELLGYDAMLTLSDLAVEASGFGAKVEFPIEDTPYPDYNNPLIKEVADYGRLEPYDPRESLRTKGMIKVNELLVKAKGKEVPTIGFMNGPLCTLSMLRGCERLFVDCIRHPKEVHLALEIITTVLVDYASPSFLLRASQII